jgi:hypothetical protein
MYDRIEKELKDIQQAIQSSHAVSTAPPSTENVELGDDPTQLRKLADATETRLCRVQEEKEQATNALRQEKESLEQLRVVKKEKYDLQTKFEEDKEKIQKEKDQLLAERTMVREAVTRALRSMPGLEQVEEEIAESQVEKLTEAIQQLQARVVEL